MHHTVRLLHAPRVRLAPFRLVFPFLAIVAVGGCAGNERTPATRAPSTTAALERSAPDRPVPSGAAAIVNGQEVPWSRITPPMVEASGGIILREFVLDTMIVDELARQGLDITPSDIDAERTLLAESIASETRATPDDTERLLDQVRRSRGLGDTRFAAQLRRTASLRRLVAGSVTVTDDEVEQAWKIRHGERLRARVILVPTAARAAALRAELESGTGPIEPRFAQAAIRESTDASAARGGVLDPISVADPSYPAAVRNAIANLQPGTLSPVVAADRGYAVLLAEGTIPGSGVTLEQSRESLRRDVRLRRERVAMDALAARLIAQARVSVLDRSLDWSWRAATPR